MVSGLFQNFDKFDWQTNAANEKSYLYAVNVTAAEVIKIVLDPDKTLSRCEINKFSTYQCFDKSGLLGPKLY